MILEKSKCEKEFLERLINDTDEVYKLSPFYKRMAYLANIKDEDIVFMFEKQMSKEVLKDAIRIFMEKKFHNIDIIKI